MMRLLLLLPLLASASNTFGAKFLDDNKGKSGVITLPSGLQYKVLQAGNGLDHPTVDSPCSCHYEGRTAEDYPSGPKFDSSYDRGTPTRFAPNQVIRGWTEAMQLMVEGDKWEMYIPSDLAYGDGGRPPKIPGGAVLVFTMEILKIEGAKIPAQRTAGNTPPADTSANVSEGTVQDFGDGLKLSVIQAGDGKTFPHPGDSLSMHYVLKLAGDSSGKIIDSSRSRNQPFTFTIGRGEVIRGWDMGVMKMSLGQRGVLTVPSALGYGASGAGGAIPPNADLSFDVEVLRIGQGSLFGGLDLSLGIPVLVVVVGVIGLLMCHMSSQKGTPAEKVMRHTIEMGLGKSAAE